MPTTEELLPLFDPSHNAGSGFVARGQRFVAHLDPLFSGIGAGAWVWGLSPPTGAEAAAINFNIQKEVRLARAQQKYTVRAFAVRALPAGGRGHTAQVEPDIRVVHAGGTARVLEDSPVVAVTEPDVREAGLGPSTRESIRLVLEAKLLSQAGIAVVADSRLRAELRERKRTSYEECYDESCQIELGKAVAARMILNTRVLREPGPLCSLSLRLLDLQSETTKASAFVQSHSECGPRVTGALAAAAVAALLGEEVKLGAGGGGSPAGGSSPRDAGSGGASASDSSLAAHYSRLLELQLSCLDNPDPGAVLRGMLRAGLLRETSFGVGGVPVLEPTTEIRVFGARVLFVEGWQLDADREVRPPFYSGPGTASAHFIKARLDAKLSEVQYSPRSQPDNRTYRSVYSTIRFDKERYDSQERVNISCVGWSP